MEKVTKIISSLNLLLVYVLFFSHTIIEIAVFNILNVLSEQKNKTFSGVQLVVAANLYTQGESTSMVIMTCKLLPLDIGAF